MSLDALLLLVAGVAIVARALFVAGDAALSGVSPERAAELNESRPGLETRALLDLKTDLEGSAATARGGAIAALAVAAALAGAASFRMLGPALDELPMGNLLAAAMGGGASTLAILLVDLVPRSLAVADPEGWAGRLALPYWLAWRFVGPPARLLLRLVDTVLRPLGARATFRSAPPALEDLERYLIEEAREDEDGPAPELVHSLFTFSSRIAREVMVPRTEVVAVPLGIAPEELVQLLAERGHSRLPVYDGEIDRIVGVLHTRDIVPLLAHPELIKLPDVIRPANFVPWATRIERLLREMQREKIHMAMVTDEHGGFMGVVTLEDILEEIVGDLPDEHDDGAKEIESLADGSHRVDASIALPDFNEAMGTSLPEDEDFDTLAGFLNSLAGEIPETGATLHANGLIFTVEERSPRRVVAVRVARIKVA